MRSAPTTTQLLRATQQIAAAWIGRDPSVLEVNLGYHRGLPAILVTGATQYPPQTFPKGVRLRNSDTSIYLLPIVWRRFVGVSASKPMPMPAAKDLNLDMWNGAPPVQPDDVRLIAPNAYRFPTEQAPVPQADGDNAQASIPMRQPQFVTPNFWAKAFYQCNEACLTNYDTWVTPLRFTVPADYLLVITGISYELHQNLQTFDQFKVRVRRSSTDVLAEWFDMIALPNPDPALQNTFGGHIQPIPFYGRFDHDQTLAIDIKALGPYPFTKTVADSLGGCVHVCAQGWLASLYDNRDGGARPVDMGDLNAVVEG